MFISCQNDFDQVKPQKRAVGSLTRLGKNVSKAPLPFGRNNVFKRVNS